MRRAGWVILALALSSKAVWAQEAQPSCLQMAEWRAQALTPGAGNLPLCPYGQAVTPPPVTRDASPKLQFFGVVLMVTGVIQVLPYGDHYKIFDSDVCVTDYSIEHGACARPRAQVLVGAAMVGTGFAFFKMGGRQVAIRPEIASQRRAVSATLRW